MTDRLSVVQVGYYPPPLGGESVHVQQLTDALRQGGHEVTVVNAHRGAPFSPEYRRITGPWSLMVHLRECVSSGTVLHLHTNGHNASSWMLMALAAFCAGRGRCAAILTLHSGLLPAYVAGRAWVARAAMRFALRGFAQLICVTPEIADAARALGVPDEKMSVIPAYLGVPALDFSVAGEQVVSSAHSPTIVCAAGKGPEYGLPVLRRTLERLVPKFPGLRCVVTGAGADETFARDVQAHGLERSVTCLGEVPHRRFLALLSRADAFVRPTYQDGDAVSVREALSLRIPVVASDAATRPAGVVVFRSGDADDLAERLNEVLDGRRPGSVAPTDGGVDTIIALYRAVRRDSAPPAARQRRLVAAVAGAVQAVARECVGFSFDYPIQNLEGSARGALPYHIHSDRLFLEHLECDRYGIPMARYRLLGKQYNPVFVAWWGLVCLNRFTISGDTADRDRFLTQLQWLKEHAAERSGGAVVWPCYFDWQEGKARLRAPWISAMYQGLVVSALVRGYRLNRDSSLLDLALRGVEVFRRAVEDGGVRTTEGGHVLYEEYPAYPLPRVLDGFLFSLLGLYDLASESEERAVRDLFDEGVRGLRFALPRWDYRGKWTWYGTHGSLCPPHYHALNRRLLAIIGRLADDASLVQQAERWAPERLSPVDKLEVYAMFVLTKNWARLTLPNEQGRTIVSCVGSPAS